MREVWACVPGEEKVNYYIVVHIHVLYYSILYCISQYTTVYYIAIHYSEYCHLHLFLRWRGLAMISFRRCWTGRWWTGGTSVKTRSPFSTLGGSSGRRDCCVVSSEHLALSGFGSTIAPIPPLYTSLVPGLSTVQFLIACSMQKWWGKAWYHLSCE